MIDQTTRAKARAQARVDLNRLRTGYVAHRDAHHEDEAVVRYVQGILRDRSWGRVELAAAIAEALVLLEKRAEDWP